MLWMSACSFVRAVCIAWRSACASCGSGPSLRIVWKASQAIGCTTAAVSATAEHLQVASSAMVHKGAQHAAEIELTWLCFASLIH